MCPYTNLNFFFYECKLFWNKCLAQMRLALFTNKSSSKSSSSNTIIVVYNNNTYILYNSNTLYVFGLISGRKSKVKKPHKFPTFSIKIIKITSL